MQTDPHLFPLSQFQSDNQVDPPRPITWLKIILHRQSITISRSPPACEAVGLENKN